MDEQELTKAKILGVLIQDARQHAGRSVADCAAILDLSPESFAQAEKGEYIISLPELEVLALYLDVPMAHFWGSHTLERTEMPNYALLLTLRQKIVGALLGRARQEAGQSVQELAEKTDIPAGQILRYELGQDTIPLLKLEKMARALDKTLDYFAGENRGPLARHEQNLKMQRHFSELPPEIQAFVSEPVNHIYLETAMRLSEMNTQRLRSIAEGLLDITL